MTNDELSGRDSDDAVSDDDTDFDDASSSEDVSVDDPFDSIDVETQAPSAEQSLRYFGADFDVEGLVRRLTRDELQVPTFSPESSDGSGFEGFQRRFVWPKKQMDRFIESLLLGYPVPGIFLVELANRRYLVLDGQQRLRTLAAFYEGIYKVGERERIFNLTYVGSNFKGRGYKTLDPADRRLLDNTFIQATVVVPNEDGKDAVYKLFERINSSGMKLQPQEIRVALFSGPAIRFIRDLNTIDPWRNLFGREHSRLKDHELILRYLALTETAELIRKFEWDPKVARIDEQARGVELSSSIVYRPPMSSFLNRYLERHENLQGVDVSRITTEFQTICKAILDGGGEDSLKWRGSIQVNAAHTDALLVGATLASRAGIRLTPATVRTAIDNLRANMRYVVALSESTSHTDNVCTRLQSATQAFTSS
ncbi:DUF262 domain-containing protein [Pseudonocardia xinjiangensis]|uniref:DUF262 domain-containing protein n=1 Tax=Pseudonocardia xinjiangensis TaxID=75289 RepID=UPI003D8A3013